MSKKVVIIGAGPGGLAAGMLLAYQGFDVHIYEKQTEIGGRNARLTLGDFTFDLGPTFLMYTKVLEELFAATSRKLDDYVKLLKIDPLYRLKFKNEVEFYPTNDIPKMLEEIKRVFPGDEQNYLKFLEKEGKKFDAVAPILTLPYDKLSHLLRPEVLKAVPRLDLGKTLYQKLAEYFQHDDMRISMTFQAKYLGMSPWECPALFSIISYIEHKFGIYHVAGGLNQICHTMANILQEEGGHLHVSSAVAEVLVENKKAVGIKLETGELIYSDYVIINADFAHTMTHMVNKEHRKKYTDEKLSNRQYSCSTFMIYLGLDKLYNIPHHNIIFSEDYQRNVEEIVKTGTLSQDPSIYIHNPSIIDSTLAPSGKSALYILVPVANTTAPIDWEKEKSMFRKLTLDIIKKKTELTDLEDHIEVEKIITPDDWENQYNVYKGAVFNMSHKMNQLLYKRPRNRFEEFENCYLVGGGTHPGSGLPTIYQSAQVSAGLIIEDTRKHSQSFSQVSTTPMKP